MAVMLSILYAHRVIVVFCIPNLVSMLNRVHDFSKKCILPTVKNSIGDKLIELSQQCLDNVKSIRIIGCFLVIIDNSFGYKLKYAFDLFTVKSEYW